MELDFGEVLTIIGLLLVGAATVSGYTQRSVLSIAVLSVGAGLVLSAVGILTLQPGADGLIIVVELVLLLTLFSDGLLVENELLRRHWSPAARALVIAMPLNAVALALAARLLFGDLTWPEAFVLGFALSPTDPVITSSIVASPRVPRLVRHTLNVESGLNDGLALPFVLFFLALSDTTDAVGSAAESAGDLAVESLIGLAVGAALALAAGRLLHALPDQAITSRYEGLYALGLGVGAFGVADLAHGNGLIAAFVAGVGLGVVRHEIPEVFLHFNENLSSVLQVIAFVIFGALVVRTGWDENTLALLAFIIFALLVARPASVLVAFTGVKLSRPSKLFVAWFGPKGIASMLFALFVLNSGAPDRTAVFDIAAFTILASIVAHGLTDTLGARWIERRVGEGSHEGGR
jgi:NhaP-type Na+/H+ or K+/H+ antiporter